jgi:hypothetical protein
MKESLLKPCCLGRRDIGLTLKEKKAMNEYEIIEITEPSDFNIWGDLVDGITRTPTIDFAWETRKRTCINAFTLYFSIDGGECWKNILEIKGHVRGAPIKIVPMAGVHLYKLIGKCNGVAMAFDVVKVIVTIDGAQNRRKNEQC